MKGNEAVSGLSTGFGRRLLILLHSDKIMQ